MVPVCGPVPPGDQDQEWDHDHDRWVGLEACTIYTYTYLFSRCVYIYIYIIIYIYILYIYMFKLQVLSFLGAIRIHYPKFIPDFTASRSTRPGGDISPLELAGRPKPAT